MHRIHPEVINFTKYCHDQGVDLLDLPQQYAKDNPLSYADYLMSSGWTSECVIDQALQWGWNISECPAIVLEIAWEASNVDGEFGLDYETLESLIQDAFNSASPEIKALAKDGRLVSPYRHPEDEEDIEE